MFGNIIALVNLLINIARFVRDIKSGSKKS